MSSKVKARHPSCVRAELRFKVIGGLLGSPPQVGELHLELEALAQKQWFDPSSGEMRRFSFSTIERWYYRALSNQSPIKALKSKVRMDTGTSRGIDARVLQFWTSSYRDYPSWQRKLHYDNCKAWAKDLDPPIDRLPSYSTLVRQFDSMAWVRKQKPRTREDGSPLLSSVTAIDRKIGIEVRSYEAEFVGQLYHLDFHKGSRAVLTENSQWVRPMLLAVIDDKSRLLCHAQWFLGETTGDLIHGFIQALLRRGMPRVLMTDNGSAMISEEFVNGLSRNSIVHETTMAYSPYQNGKQERFWGTLESRLMAMIEKVNPLTLKSLNDLTLTWIDQEYNQTPHSETKEIPSKSFYLHKPVLRISPGFEGLKQSFIKKRTRRQRKTDGTISVEGIRYEVPSCYRHLNELYIGYQSFNLNVIYLLDPKTEDIVSQLTPIDLVKNSQGKRISNASVRPIDSDRVNPEHLPPRMRQLVKQQEDSMHLPPYLPKKD